MSLILGQAKGDAVPSFTSRLLQEGVSPEDEELLKWASFSMYLGKFMNIVLETSVPEHGSIVHQVDLTR